MAGDPDAFAALLDRYAPLRPAPLSPEILVFFADGLVEVWEAAERLAGGRVGAPFWAFPWPGGAAIARVVLDRPDRVRGRRVLDLGCGGGIAALAAAKAGASVVANDLDPWALEAARLAATRQGLSLDTLPGDLTADPDGLAGFDVILCGDVGYERSVAPRIRAALDRAMAAGAVVLAADAGRAYFDDRGLTPVAAFTLPVPENLEGVATRTARVFLGGSDWSPAEA